MKITCDLMMKAAKFIQNHKVKCETVVFNSQDERIEFLDSEGFVVAYTAYTQYKGSRDCWYTKAK